MSEQNTTPQARPEEPELKDEALEQVAGGCQWGDSMGGGDKLTLITPTFPTTDA
jgi:hypothetical protein